ncbi:PLP-dependent aminotransferase family protein [Lacihabitans sp. LS3-19]|uniref:aminotransferase-like domain-containing protein n=1 Tax=Lacihabitans sp. LS3-19 TaxID=2487335 RepID=UPI0020CB7A08|nr:PLP-dependent aminotransferase family protein [Lacihabitans sp. LS3-19]MCP9766340.1 PLP-dependent aminotransferase family protein [Lacihabitans sp. LS3-19]
MVPYLSTIQIDHQSKTPIYQQISNQFILLIQKGILKPGQQIISSRALSETLKVHRKTILMAFDELILQGWVESRQSSGTFIAQSLPEIKPQTLIENTGLGMKLKAGFDIEAKPHLQRAVITSSDLLHLDDGFPDPRIAPLSDLARAYRSNLLNGNLYQKLGYSETKGTPWLRKELAVFLNESRGLNITENNIIILRGTIMGLYLSNLALVKANDYVAIGEASWQSARISFMNAGAKIIDIPIDENGIVVDELEEICKKTPIRMVYITSHHNYPTTVSMKADRRLKLLDLAQRYRFIVFEDDYDYDFHYQSRPLMPLASADDKGVVLYSGSFTKSISPAFRVGYLVASEEVIEHLAIHRRLIDRQGDNMLENAIAQLLHEGILQKHLRKALKEYKQRRDFFCEILSETLRDEVSFEIPEGGMSVWTKFDSKIDIKKTAEIAHKNGLYFSNGLHHNIENKIFNCTRLGFASSTLEELQTSINILKNSLTYF